MTRSFGIIGRRVEWQGGTFEVLASEIDEFGFWVFLVAYGDGTLKTVNSHECKLLDLAEGPYR